MPQSEGPPLSGMEDRSEKLGAWYTDAEMLTLRTRTGTRKVPYTLEFLYADHPELDETWGFAEVLERNYLFPVELEGYRSYVYAKYPSKIARPDDHEAVCPRVAHFSQNQAGFPHWKIELAHYADQIGTNMYPDERFEPAVRIDAGATDVHSVREFDQAVSASPRRLPSFGSSRLSNTIGVAVGIVAKRENGREVLLWRRRSLKVRIYPGAPGMPLSFALNLPLRDWHGSQSVRDLILLDADAERAEELGVERHQFSGLKPIAFCRDLPRAGKPQFFLEKRAWRTFEQLRTEVVKDSPEWIGELEAIDVGDDPPEGASPELLAYFALRQRF